MTATGVVFDIKEFAVFDGPGIRTTVFLKGCPLRCMWCHNPEGLAVAPQLMVSEAACKHCGACRAVCPSPDGPCTACGACVRACPYGLRKIAGARWTAVDLAAELLKGRALFDQSGGGVTFSGGEPLMQWDFIAAVVPLLQGVHTAIETSGYTSDAIFRRMMNTIDLVMMDVKLLDPEAHRYYTGVTNEGILRHLDFLCAGQTPFIVRVPLIPGVNDTPDHLEGVAARIAGAPALVRAELLPYHQTAGAKYSMLGMDYAPTFDVNGQIAVDLSPFETRGIEVKVM